MQFWRTVFLLALTALMLSIVATIARAETYLPRGFGDTSRRERIMQTTDVLRVGDVRSSGSLSLDSFLDMPKTYIDADGNISTSGTVRASAYYGSGAYLTDLETWPDNVITVGAENCNHTSVQAAINAASSGDVVLVMPGTYNEQITGKSGVTVRGVSRDASIIRYDVQFSSPYGPEDSSISWGGAGTFAVENLALQNLVAHNPSGGAATVLYTYGSAVLRVRDCNITGSDNDTVSGWETSQTYLYRCRIETLNSQPDQFYFGNTSTLYVYGCELISSDVYFYLVDTPTVTVLGTRATGGIFPGTALAGTYKFIDCTRYWPEYSITEKYGVQAFQDEAQFSGKMSARNDALLLGEIVFGEDTTKTSANLMALSGINDLSPDMVGQWRVVGDDSALMPIMMEWSGDGSTWDTNLYRSAADTLKTDDTFEAASLTTDRISSDNATIMTATATTLSVSGAASFNTSGGANAFKVSGDNVEHLIYTDAANDRIGIGTGTPEDVVSMHSAGLGGMGLARYNSSAGSGPYFAFRRSKNATLGGHTIVADGDVIGVYTFNGSNGTTWKNAAQIRAYVDGTPGSGDDMPGRLEFWTTPDGSATAVNRMSIGNDGHVYPGADNTYTMGKNGARWSAVWAANGTIQTSDIRQKKDVAAITPTLAKSLMEISPIIFEWDSPAPSTLKSRKHLGFSAQDVAAVLAKNGMDPEKSGIVYYDEAGQPVGLAYSELIPILWGVVREQEKRLDAIEARLSALEAK